MTFMSTSITRAIGGRCHQIPVTSMEQVNAIDDAIDNMVHGLGDHDTAEAIEVLRAMGIHVITASE